MLYHLIYPLRTFFSPFNVVGYITFRTIAVIIVSLVLSYLLSKKIIPFIRSRQFVQSIRNDGPQSHLSKSGTPTMGGIIILITIVLSTLICARLDNRFIVFSLICVIWLGFLGFLDDYFKVIKKNSKGLTARWKLAGQVFFSAIVAVYLYYFPSNYIFSTSINIPYLKDVYINLGILYMLFVIIIIVGASNAVNLTDGLDGLAIGCLMISAFAYAIFAYLAGHAKLSTYLKIIPVSGSGELTIFLAAIIGAGLGFLWFNTYPAEIFMGDTGSLFLGGSIGLVAVFIKQEMILIVVGGVFVIEALSVMLQVFVFKRYKKRIFRMAPLHHHYELSGIPEPKVTIRFWIIGIILMLVAFSSLKLR